MCRAGSSAALPDTGEVPVAGGLIGLQSNPAPPPGAILHGPASSPRTSTGSAQTGRAGQTATPLTCGQVLVSGGTDFVNHTATFLTSAELHTP